MAKAKRLGEKGCPVILELSDKEADALYHVCFSIGGEPTGPRGVFSGPNGTDLLYVLEKAGAKRLAPYDPKAGNFTFLDNLTEDWKKR